jgi:predicted DNA binding CopG/RHH family protein
MKRKAKRTRPNAPSFANEDEERKYWAEHDLTEHFAWDKAVKPTFSNLKPSTTAISLRLPISMLEELKVLANRQDVPYQSLMKLYLGERIKRERSRKAS